MFPPQGLLSLWIRPEDFAPLALEVANGLSQVVTQSRQRSKKKSEKIAQASGMIWEQKMGELQRGKKSNSFGRFYHRKQSIAILSCKL